MIKRQTLTTSCFSNMKISFFFVFSAGKLNIFGFLSVVLGKTSSLNEITCVLGNLNGQFSLIFDMLSTKCSIQEIIGRKPDNDNNNLSCSTVRFSVQLTPKEELSLKDTCVLPFPFIIRYLMRLHILFYCQCSHLLNLNIYKCTQRQDGSNQMRWATFNLHCLVFVYMYGLTHSQLI